MNVIVVGVDDSDGAKAALAFAHEEALLRNATLRAVHAWQFGYIGDTGFEGAVPAVGGDIAELRAAAAAALDATVRAALPDPGGVEIEQRVVEGTAGAVLVDESSRADLLVVGSRGHGGFAQLLLGSVGQQCAHHAACPVVIVRPTAEAAVPRR
jgi:nucleotide-binding universal stress UspA family protein